MFSLMSDIHNRSQPRFQELLVSYFSTRIGKNCLHYLPSEMRLDALNWNIKWQQNAVCACPLLSSATIHFTRHQEEAGCPGFKSISEDCSCHLFPNLKMTAVALVSKWLPRTTYRNSKLFVENDKCWALAELEEQSSQRGDWRWLSFSQCKMRHSLQVTLCLLWNNMENRALVHILTSCTSLAKASWMFGLCRTT